MSNIRTLEWKLQGLADQIGNCLGRPQPLQRSVAWPLHATRRRIAIGDRTYSMRNWPAPGFIHRNTPGRMRWMIQCLKTVLMLTLELWTKSPGVLPPGAEVAHSRRVRATIL